MNAFGGDTFHLVTQSLLHQVSRSLGYHLSSIIRFGRGKKRFAIPVVILDLLNEQIH